MVRGARQLSARPLGSRMTIQELGSLGELVAAIATVVTLAYLALQIRQNTRALRVTALQVHQQQVQQTVNLVAASAENASVWRRGIDDPQSLSPGELAQFTAMLLGVYNQMDAAFTNHRNGLLPEEEWRRDWGVLRFYLRSKGGSQVWDIAKQLHSVSPEFMALAEAEMLGTP